MERFRLGIDHIPDWFMDLVTQNRVILHGESGDLKLACRINGDHIQCINKGDWVEK